MEIWRRYFQKTTALCLCAALLAGCLTCGLSVVPAAAAPLDWEEPDVPPEEPDVPPEEPDVPPEEPDVPPEEPDVPPEEPDVPPEEPDVPPEEPDVPPEEPDVPPEEPDVPPEEPDALPEEPDVPSEEPDAPPEEPDIPPEESDIPPEEPEEMPEFVDPPALLTAELGQPYEYLEIDSDGTVSGAKEGFDDALLIAGGYLEIPSEIDGTTVTGIGSFAFSGNPYIKSLKVPDIALPSGAFAGCSELSELVFSGEPGDPAGFLVSLGAFSQCTALTSITISCTTVNLIGRAFNDLPIAEVIVTTNVAAENLQYFEFRADTLKTVVFSSGVTALPARAFTACSADSTVELPAGLAMDANAFGGAVFQRLILNGLSAGFANLPASVAEITFAGSSRNYDSAGVSALNSASGLETLNLSVDSLDEIKQIFSSWSGSSPNPSYLNLKEVNFLADYDAVPSFLLDECTWLERVTLPEGLRAIGDAAFYETSLREINFPGSLETIGESAFEFTDLETLDLSHTQVQSIGSVAFAGCARLTNARLPGSLLLVDGLAFSQCANLESVEFAGGSPLTIGTGAFMGASSLNSLTLPDTLQSVAYDAANPVSGAFYGTALVNRPEAARLAVVFPPDTPSGSLISQWNAFYDRLEATLAAQIDFARLSALSIQVDGVEVDLTGTALQLADLAEKYAAAAYLSTPEELWANAFRDPQTPERPRGVVSAAPALHPGGLMEFLACPELQSAYASLPAGTQAALGGLADQLLDAMEGPVQAAADGVTVRCVAAQALRGPAWLGEEQGAAPPRIRRAGRRRE